MAPSMSGKQGEAGDTVTESSESLDQAATEANVPLAVFVGKEGWYRGPTPVPSGRDGCFFMPSSQRRNRNNDEIVYNNGDCQFGGRRDV